MLGGDPSLGWDCGNCIGKEEQRARNCTGRSAKFHYLVARPGLWVLKFDRCPKSWLRDEAVRERMMFEDATRFLTHGVLPRDGGWEDQPPKLCQAISVVDDVIALVRRGNG